MKKVLFILVAMLLIIGCDDGGKKKDDADLDQMSDSDIVVTDETADEMADETTDETTDEADDEEDDASTDDTVDIDEVGDEDELPDENGEFPETVCETLTPLESGTCSVKAGNEFKLLKGNILGAEGNFIGGQVLISDEGGILCVGCNCEGETGAEGATEIVCPQGVISPALINAHDHISWAHHDPKVWNDERFDHRHDWRKGLNGHTDLNDSSGSSPDTKTWGELRNVMSGTISMAGSGGADGFLRNVDQNFKNTEGLGSINVYYNTFPLGDSKGEMLESGCDYPRIDSAFQLKNECYLPHVSEGINKAARNEFLCLSGAEGGVDLTEENSVYIHLVGLNAADGAELSESGTSLIWSARTNISLYGNTAQVTMMANQGVLIGLGTDWVPSGSINLLREYKCVDKFNKTNLNTYFTDREMWLMGTENNAVALRIADVTGTLRVGLAADISIFDGKDAENFYRAIIDGSEKEVSLVMRGGKPLYGDKNIMESLSGTDTCDEIDVCGSNKVVCVKSETGMTLSELQSKNSSSYGLFFCDTPDDEPTCVPSRTREIDEIHTYTGVPTANDSDGDGIEDAEDNCPNIFNPIRPVDGNDQGDEDGDGVGDVCDPCPLVQDSTDCTVPDLDDRDGDGIRNVEDNCPYVANADQADADNDWMGDVCDLCPDVSNPLASDCPTEDLTIYDIMKDGRPLGAPVKVEGIVTAFKGKAFYIQVDPDNHDATLKEKYSGIYVYVSSSSSLTSPALGDKIAVTGKVDDYYGQTQIGNVEQIDILTASKGIPDAVAVLPAAIKTGGADAMSYNSVFVKVENVKVTAEADSYDEFEVTDGLLFDDYLYDYTNPALDSEFTYIQGILTFSFGNSKILPRSEDDFGVDRCKDVTCDDSWSECNEDTGQCDPKTGFCAVKTDCPGTTRVCNTTTHLCEDGDPCAAVTCSDEWMECDPELGACAAKDGRCDTDADCTVAPALNCDSDTHLCAEPVTEVPNGDFESWSSGDAEGWSGESGVDAVEETTEKHSGSSSVKLTRTKDDNGDTEYKSDFFPVTAEVEYTISAWFLDKDAFDAKGRVLIRWYDASKVEVPSSVSYGSYSSDSDSWTQVTSNATAPTGAAFGKVGVRVYKDGGATTGIFLYVDDYEITAN